MTHRLKNFLRDDDGAVTVDWVVLTAAVIALGAVVASSVSGSAIGLSDDIWAYMDSLDLFSD